MSAIHRITKLFRLKLFISYFDNKKKMHLLVLIHFIWNRSFKH